MVLLGHLHLQWRPSYQHSRSPKHTYACVPHEVLCKILYIFIQQSNNQYKRKHFPMNWIPIFHHQVDPTKIPIKPRHSLSLDSLNKTTPSLIHHLLYTADSFIALCSSLRCNFQRISPLLT